MTGELRIEHYDWGGGREAMLRFGLETGPTVIAALPLFEEANRTRGFVVAVLRGLAEHGVAGALPDLPGTGESLIATEAATLAGWRSAFAAAAATLPKPTFALGFRGGALLDVGVGLAGRWHFAPVAGAALVHDLHRAAIVAAGEPSARATPPPGAPLLLAGNRIAPALLADLETASPAPARIVRLEHDQVSADRRFPGALLWRRIEPGEDPALAAALVSDIVTWIEACGG